VPGVWTAIRFVHVLSAIAWVGVQLTLFMLFPVLRRRLEAEQFRTVARTAGMRLGIVAVITLPGRCSQAASHWPATRCRRASAAG
jgi:putative copper export protein